jgi:hypothetical protein
MSTEQRANDFDEMIRELSASGIDESLIRRTFLYLQLGDIEQLMQQLVERFNDPFHEDQVLSALLEQAQTLDNRVMFPVIQFLELYNAKALAQPVFLDKLCQLDLARATPIVRDYVDRLERAYAAPIAIQYFYDGDLTRAIDDPARIVARLAIKQIEKQKETSLLIGALSNPHASVRQTAAWYLGRERITQAVQPLLNRLEVETDFETMRAILWALGNLGDSQAVDAVQNYVEHENPLIARTAQEALGRL